MATGDRCRELPDHTIETTGAAPVEVAHRTITVAHLGNIAMMLGRAIRWDPDKEEILDDQEASRLLFRAKREPWRV